MKSIRFRTDNHLSDFQFLVAAIAARKGGFTLQLYEHGPADYEPSFGGSMRKFDARCS